jgi:hypothetical protein
MAFIGSSDEMLGIIWWSSMLRPGDEAILPFQGATDLTECFWRGNEATVVMDRTSVKAFGRSQLLYLGHGHSGSYLRTDGLYPTVHGAVPKDTVAEET